MKDLVEQLKEHWANTPEEQLRAEWAEIEAMDINSPNALDYIHSVMNYHVPEPTDVEADKFAAGFKEIPNFKNGYRAKETYSKPTKRKTNGDYQHAEAA